MYNKLYNWFIQVVKKKKTLVREKGRDREVKADFKGMLSKQLPLWVTITEYHWGPVGARV